MKEIIIYLLKSSLWVGVFWMIYWLFLRKETFYKFNRFFLLFGLVVSFILPFCIYKYTIELNLPQITVADSYGVAAPINQGFTISPWVAIILLHVVGALFLLFRHLRGALKLKKLILRNGFCRESGVKVVHTQDVDSTFSVFSYIFIDFSSCISEVERKLIYEHERAHINQYHWIDLMIIHAVCIIQWFNPFVWVYLNSIKQNHEFLADQEVLKHGNSPALYRAALINYTFKTPVFAFANAFAQYNKFKRIDMMKKENSNPKKKWAVLLLVPVLVVFLWIFAEPQYVFANNNKQFEKVNFEFFFESMEAENSVSGDTVINNITNIIVINTDKKAETSAKVHTIDTIDFKVNVIGTQDTQEDKDEVVVVGYGVQRNKTLSTLKMELNDGSFITGRASGIVFSSQNEKAPLFIIDGKESDTDFHKLKPDEIESITVLKNPHSVQTYGDKGENGVVLVSTKKQIKINSENNKQPILIIDGEELGIDMLNKLSPNEIKSFVFLTDKDAVRLSGDERKDQVIQVTTKRRAENEDLEEIVIRTVGKNQISSAEKPLIIIDGVTSEDGFGNLEPEDIKSLSILKDASAVSIYGDKAKAGVILITTKEAAKKEKSN